MTANVSATRRVCGANHRKLDRQALRSQFRRRFGYCQANQQLFRASSEETLSPRPSSCLRKRETTRILPPDWEKRLGMKKMGRKSSWLLEKPTKAFGFSSQRVLTRGGRWYNLNNSPLKGFAEQEIGLQKPSCRGRPSLERHKGSVPAEPETKQKQEVASDDFQTSV
jgi:hypothetical protein